MHSTKLLRSASVGSGCAHPQFELLVEVAVEDAPVPPDVNRVPEAKTKSKTFSRILYVGAMINVKET